MQEQETFALIYCMHIRDWLVFSRWHSLDLLSSHIAFMIKFQSEIYSVLFCFTIPPIWPMQKYCYCSILLLLLNTNDPFNNNSHHSPNCIDHSVDGVVVICIVYAKMEWFKIICFFTTYRYEFIWVRLQRRSTARLQTFFFLNFCAALLFSLASTHFHLKE